MKKWLLSLCIILSVIAEEEEEPTGVGRKKQPGYATRDATVLSVIGWGVSIAVAIATFAALVHNHPVPTTPSSSTTTP